MCRATFVNTVGDSDEPTVVHEDQLVWIKDLNEINDHLPLLVPSEVVFDGATYRMVTRGNESRRAALEKVNFCEYQMFLNFTLARTVIEK